MATKSSTQEMESIVINKVASSAVYQSMVTNNQINENELYLVMGDETPEASSATPAMDGTASAGSSTAYARGDHVHPTDTSRAPTSHASSATTYGVGTSSNYGHVKLSDSTSSTSSTSAGVAATPAAVKAAYDLANGKTSNTGTVTNVATGNGLTGGPITTSGTISVSYGTATPAMDGTGAVGTATTVARSDHVHPTDTSRASAADVSLLSNNVTSISSFADDYFGVDSAQVISGYNTSNSSSARARNAPFIPEPFISGQSISWIKLNVMTAGTLTIGCYKENDLVLSSTEVTSSYIPLKTVTISATGEQTLTFSPSIYIPNGYVFSVGSTADTCTFAYGDYGTTKSYYWFENSTPRIVRQTTGKSLGLDIGCIEYNAMAALNGWELINSTTTTEEVTSLMWNTDTNGDGFELRKFMIIGTFICPAAATNTGVGVAGAATSSGSAGWNNGALWTGGNWTPQGAGAAAGTASHFIVQMENPLYNLGFGGWQMSVERSANATSINGQVYTHNGAAADATRFAHQMANNSTSDIFTLSSGVPATLSKIWFGSYSAVFGVGSTFRLYGVRA